ncbi:MAG: glycosyltransferase family 39 protein [bacterium]|nr:glycosyltransferase family 39 protein [bacterium]
MKQLFTNWKILLPLIFLLAFVLRVFDVGKNPTFISDEASIGYNAYSVLKTGKDEWGSFLPLAFKSFGEYKLPIYIYSAAPIIAIFGLTEFAVRLPSIFFGSLTVLALYFLTRELLPKKGYLIPLLASFLLTINPWHIQVSRMALEANLGLFLTVLGGLFLLRARKNSKFYFFAFPVFVLTLYTYNSCRVFTPLFLLFYFFFSRAEIRVQSLAKPAIIAFLIVLPLIFSGFSGSSQRLYKVGIFNNPGIISQINEQRGECLKQSGFVCSLRFSKPTIYSEVFIKNYLSHFSLDFLFKAGAGLSQYTMPVQGMLYFWELPFLLIGIIYLFWSKRIFIFLLAWLLIGPLANSFTGTAHPVRSLLMLPVFPVLTAVGLGLTFEIFGKRKYLNYIFPFLFILLITVSSGSFLFKYFTYYPLVSNWNWQMGYENLYQDLSKLEPTTGKIYVSKFYGEPHIFYLFENKYDPKSYQKNTGVVRYDREDLWTNVDQIGKYYFVQDPKQIVLGDNDILVVSPQEGSFGGEILESVKYNNGEIAFLIYRK